MFGFLFRIFGAFGRKAEVQRFGRTAAGDRAIQAAQAQRESQRPAEPTLDRRQTKDERIPFRYDDPVKTLHDTGYIRGFNREGMGYVGQKDGQYYAAFVPDLNSKEPHYWEGPFTEKKALQVMNTLAEKFETREHQRELGEHKVTEHGSELHHTRPHDDGVTTIHDTGILKGFNCEGMGYVGKKDNQYYAAFSWDLNQDKPLSWHGPFLTKEKAMDRMHTSSNRWEGHQDQRWNDWEERQIAEHERQSRKPEKRPDQEHDNEMERER